MDYFKNHFYNKKFFISIQNDEIDEVEKELLEGANPNITNDEGFYPIHIATRHGHESIVELLLESGADPTTKDANGCNALHVASKERHAHLIPILVKCPFSDKSSNIKNLANVPSSNGDTPLHISADHASLKCIKKLLALEGNAMARDILGNTPLHRLILKPMKNTSKKRVDRWNAAALELISKMDVNAMNNKYETPLQLAISSNYPTIAQFLMKAGAINYQAGIESTNKNEPKINKPASYLAKKEIKEKTSLDRSRSKTVRDASVEQVVLRLDISPEKRNRIKIKVQSSSMNNSTESLRNLSWSDSGPLLNLLPPKDNIISVRQLKKRRQRCLSPAGFYSEGGGLGFHVSGDAPKAFSRTDKDRARQRFVKSRPVSIEKSVEDLSYRSIVSLPDLSEEGWEKMMRRREEWSKPIYSVMLPVSKDGRRPRKTQPYDKQSMEDKIPPYVPDSTKKKLLYGPYAQPYKSFGKIVTKTDALEAAMIDNENFGDEYENEYMYDEELVEDWVSKIQGVDTHPKVTDNRLSYTDRKISSSSIEADDVYDKMVLNRSYDDDDVNTVLRQPHKNYKGKSDQYINDTSIRTSQDLSNEKNSRRPESLKQTQNKEDQSVKSSKKVSKNIMFKDNNLPTESVKPTHDDDYGKKGTPSKTSNKPSKVYIPSKLDINQVKKNSGKIIDAPNRPTHLSPTKSKIPRYDRTPTSAVTVGVIKKDELQKIMPENIVLADSSDSEDEDQDNPFRDASESPTFKPSKLPHLINKPDSKILEKQNSQKKPQSTTTGEMMPTKKDFENLTKNKVSENDFLEKQNSPNISLIPNKKEISNLPKKIKSVNKELEKQNSFKTIPSLDAIIPNKKDTDDFPKISESVKVPEKQNAQKPLPASLFPDKKEIDNFPKTSKSVNKELEKQNSLKTKPSSNAIIPSKKDSNNLLKTSKSEKVIEKQNLQEPSSDSLIPDEKEIDNLPKISKSVNKKLEKQNSLKTTPFSDLIISDKKDTDDLPKTSKLEKVIEKQNSQKPSSDSLIPDKKVMDNLPKTSNSVNKELEKPNSLKTRPSSDAIIPNKKDTDDLPKTSNSEKILEKKNLQKPSDSLFADKIEMDNFPKTSKSVNKKLEKQISLKTKPSSDAMNSDKKNADDFPKTLNLDSKEPMNPGSLSKLPLINEKNNNKGNDKENVFNNKKEKSTDCDSALIPLPCVHG